MAFVAIVLLSMVPAAAGFGWNDFTNNLATDLAPIITLFGEQVTKQYLSESLNVWDNIIFAMAPMGLLTAVVSAIRVCGSPSLKAFVGRAQESPGAAEIELLSCTSDSTAELWNDGGIARVFGRPQILEVVRLTNPQPEDYQDRDGTHQYSAGIFLFAQSVEKDIWSVHKGSRDTLEHVRHRSPNLSLNIGIKRRHEIFFHGVAFLGSCLQVGVLVFAGFTAYRFHNQFLRDGAPAEPYAFPMTVIGTVLVCLGMFFCAFIIERTTIEAHFLRDRSVNSNIYWLQPGGQKIGDQVFGSFLAVGDGLHFNRYITSSRATKTPSYQGTMLWGGVVSTTLGFVIQFIGLRAMHSSVILFQLGSTLIMAIARAGLRAQRMKSGTNTLEGVRDIEGHELDHLAMKFENVKSLVIGPEKAELSRARPYENWTNGLRAIKARIRLARLTNLKSRIEWKDLNVRAVALQLRAAIEGVMEVLALDWAYGQPERVSYFWTLSLVSEPSTPQNASPESSTLCLRIQKGKNTSWKADLAELEAAIGMWSWSLIERKARIFTYRPDVQHVRGIVMHPGTARTSYDSWIQSVVEPDSSLAPQNSQDLLTKALYFGIHAVCSFNSPRAEIFWFPTDHPIPVLCAQDIFTAFVSAALGNIQRLGGTSELRRQIGHQQPFTFENERLEEMAARVEASGLGSRSDAYLCLVPLLEMTSKMPLIDTFQDGLQPADRQKGLYWAADLGYEFAVRLLVTGGATVHEPNEDRFTGLHLAARKGHTPVVKFLLANGAAVDGLVSETRAGVDLNVDFPWVRTIWSLPRLTHKASIPLERLTALHLAAREGHLTVVELLVEAGADIERADNHGGRALTWAISGNCVSVVDYLLTMTASVNFWFESWVKCISPSSPPKQARSGKREIGGSQRDVSVTQSDIYHHTPLQWAILNKSVDIVKLLVAAREFSKTDCEVSLSLCNELDMSEIAGVLKGLRSTT